MKKIIGLKIIKTGIGATSAIWLAQLIGLKYSVAAGIITILSIQNTRRESVLIALRRLGATVIALSLGSVVLNLLGFNAVSFGIYLILFIPLAVKAKVVEGIVPASVLVTHLLGEGYTSITLLGNELLLMIVGAGIALLVNMYMPNLEEDLIREKQKLEKNMFDIFIKMENALLDNKKLEIENELEALKSALVEGRTKATQYRNNTFMSGRSLYEKYFDMRYSQYQIMLYMYKHFERFYRVTPGAEKIAKLTYEVALSVKGKIAVETLLLDLEALREAFKHSELPVTREEFENRAMLYQFLTDMEQFLDVKHLFKSSLSEREKEEYSRYYDLNVFPGK
ncbi:MAG: aromatic acid exporter family protein [Candidatus Cellulosilyticum pullistercoris]|uniref:Aromatic acid exporter family protein n=1 Tax=Candidatus Cellulosilyticum pullistercoris TaxID=2838521 RepID=A0A9E2KCB0_9FIRM|nr:aromatic acid exporter family protein [Candidatus Cellulosilyticum pullistercoris]